MIAFLAERGFAPASAILALMWHVDKGRSGFVDQAWY